MSSKRSTKASQPDSSVATDRRGQRAQAWPSEDVGLCDAQACPEAPDCALFEAAGAIVLGLDRELRLQQFTGEAARVLGLGPGCRGQALLNCPTGLDREQLRSVLESALGNGEVEARLQSATGYWFQIRGHRAEPGADLALTLSLFDVTTLVCDIEKAQESEEVYRGFIENSHSIAFRSTLDYQPYFFHGAVEQLTGYTQEAFSTGDLRWDQLIHPDDREARLRDGQVLAEQQVAALEFEYRILRSDGEVRWVRELVHNICDLTGQPRWLQGTLSDITQRRQAEQKVDELQERFRLAFQTSPDAINFNRLRDGMYVDVNEGFCAISGYSREEVLGRTDLEMKLWQNPDDRKRLAQGLRQDGEVRNMETVFCDREGQPHNVLISAVPIQLDGEDHLLTVTRDVTERRRAELARREFDAQVQQAQKLESLGILAGGIAHDFNNLLVGILGNLDLAREELPPDTAVRKLLGDTEKAARQAADLTQQMLSYSGKGKFVVRRVNLSEMTQDMTNLLTVAAGQKAKLQFDLSLGLPAVEADVSQLRQVLLNLVTNAAESGRQGPREIVVETRQMPRAESETPWVQLRVRDDGAGMFPEVVARIFDPFFTTKFTGRGLGLAAVQGIVHGHGGEVQVDSQPGRGSTFTISLPARAGEATVREVDSLPRDTSWRGEGTVLLVDDDDVVLEVGERMLRKLGFEVLSASSGAEAVELFRSHGVQICCVVLDLTMPEMGGEETLRELQLLRGDVRVLISSGYSEEEVRDRFGADGLTAFIQKPYRTADLVHQLRSVLER